MISAFHSVAIDVRAFDVGVRDYSRLLGHPPVRIEARPSGEQSAFFGLANMALEVREAPVASDPPREQVFGVQGIRLTSDLSDLPGEFGERGLGIASTLAAQSQVERELTPRSWRIDRIDSGQSRGLPVEIVSHENRSPTSGANSATGFEAFPEADPASCVRSLDHVVVMSPDPEATRRFYQEGLGLRLALDKSFEERGVRLIFFRVGGTTIEIGGRLGVEPRPDRSDRFGGLAWQVVDIEAIQARLVAEAFDVSEIRTGHKPGTRVCTVRDPVHDVPTLLIEPIS